MNVDKVVLEIGSKQYECSKRELSTFSEYFTIMFTRDFVEKNLTKIKLNNVTVTSWEYILDYLKKGFIKTDWSNGHLLDEMLDLLQTVNMFQLTDIEEWCSDIISRSVETVNCLKVLEVASRVDSEKLVRQSRAFALWRFDEVSRLDAFTRLHVDQVEGYCSDPALYCSTGEWGIWLAIDKWMNWSPDSSGSSRHQHAARLLLCLCLKALTLADLERMILFDSIRLCPLVVKAILRVIKDRSMQSLEECVQSKRLKLDEDKGCDEINIFIQNWLKVEPRKLPSVPCIVGNIFTGPDTSSPYIVKFCEVEKRFVPLTRLQKMESSAGTMMGFKVLSDGFKIYLIGGLIMNRQNLWNDAIWTYDPLKNTWSFLTSMPRPIRHMSVCLLENELYIMGGFGRHRVIQNQVTKLRLHDQVWSECASMPENLYSTPCVVFRNSVYLLHCNVYKYVPKMDVWLTMPIKPFVRGFSCAMADDDYIYLAGNSAKVIYKFDPTNLRDDLDIVGYFNHECTQACLIDGYIYSMSQDCHAEDIFCEKMNVKTGETTILYEGMTDSVIADLDPRHRHGCFSFFTY